MSDPAEPAPLTGTAPRTGTPPDGASSGALPTATGPRRTLAERLAARPVAVATAVAVGICVAYLLAPTMGGDLAAQIARADFAGVHPLVPVDFRWFSGILPFGYSLWTAPLMAVIGVRVTGAIATVVAVATFTFLLRRTGARRPLWAGVAAAVTLGSNLAEGRVTFACGVAAGLLALAALLIDGPWKVWRHPLAAMFAIAAGAASPVAAAFLLVCAVALAVRARVLDAVSILFCVLPVAIIVGLFPDGSRQVFGVNDAVRALIATAIVVVAVPPRYRALQIGGLVAFALVAVAFAVDTPFGSNSARLSLLFAAPIAIAYVSWNRWVDLVVIVAIVVVQTPITFGTLAGAGKPVTSESYFTPVADAIAARGDLTGRVEVPELTGHWDAAYLARRVPLARGWLRQTDTELNDDVFYRAFPTAATYRAFLDRSAVQYVAVPDARPTYYGRRERALIDAGLPYLTKVWTSEHWTLYAVTDPTPIVEPPGKLISYRAATIVIEAPADSEVVVRIRYFRWLSVDDNRYDRACISPRGDHVVLHTRGARIVYTITSGLYPGWFARC